MHQHGVDANTSDFFKQMETRYHVTLYGHRQNYPWVDEMHQHGVDANTSYFFKQMGIRYHVTLYGHRQNYPWVKRKQLLNTHSDFHSDL